MVKLQHFYPWLLGGIGLFFFNGTTAVTAQIAADATLSTPTIVAPGANPGLDFVITGGTQAGNNLFHSFSAFSVPSGGSAYFNNVAGIQNIIGRVTGGSASTIDGTLRANGAANLFLINPAGVIFGPGASLRGIGSFISSTAASLKLSNGDEFSAIAPASPLLTISVPIGLQFGPNAAPIQAQNAQLTTLSRTLALIGGDISLTRSTTLTALLGGRVEVGSVGPNSLVRLIPTPQGFAMDYGAVQDFRAIQLQRSSLVGRGDSSIQVRGNQVSLSDDSKLTIDGSPLANTGGISVQANQLTINNSELRTSTASTTPGTDITLTANQVTLDRASRILVETTATGRGGNVTIRAANVDLKNLSQVAAVVSQDGPAGNVTILAKNLNLQSGAQITTSTSSRGRAGSLTVDATESVVLSGVSTRPDGSQVPSGLFARSLGEGDAGILTINTRQLAVEAGAQLSASTFGTGRGGNLTINAAESVQLNGFLPDPGQNPSITGIFARTTGAGNAGSLTINTGRLAVLNGANLINVTEGSGRGGRLTINARDGVELAGVLIAADGTNLSSQISSLGSGTGTAGDLAIATRRLTVRDGAQVAAGTIGPGTGGTLTINASDLVELSGTSPDLQKVSGLFARTRGSGNAGTLTVITGDLQILDQAEITVSGLATGNAGRLNITARSIRLNNQGKIVADTLSGQGGDIVLNVDRILLLRRNSTISTSAGTAQAGGDGGNITINAPFIVGVLSENSDITANAFTGRGGNITITANAIYGLRSQPQLTPLSDITASSQLGINGTVILNTLNIDPNRGLVALPDSLVDQANQIALGCSPGGKLGRRGNQFVVTGRGGIPTSPEEGYTGGDRNLVELMDVVAPAEETGVSSQEPGVRNQPSQAVDQFPQTPTAPPPIVEAQSWVVDRDGTVQLVAQTTQPPTTFQQPFRSCDKALRTQE